MYHSVQSCPVVGAADKTWQGVILRRGPANQWFIIALAIAVLVVINIGYRAVVSDLRETLDAQLADQLAGLAETFAATLDARMVNSAMDEEAFDPEAFVRLREFADQFATANRLVSATILDTTWQDQFRLDDDSLGATVHSLLDREGRWAIRSGLTWVSETFRWEESYYRSAATPIVSKATGNWTAIARIEVDARHYSALSSLTRLAWWIHGLSLLLAVSLVGLFLWYGRSTRRWETELLRSEKLIGLGRLSATIAHEIRNPLSIIKATAQRLDTLERQGASTEKRSELLRFIPEEVERLDHILSRYLKVGAAENSHPVPVDIATHLSEWMNAIEGSERVTCRIALTPAILADRESPRQIVINLVKNALEASSVAARVDVEWDADGDGYGALRVKDHGPGIPSNLRAEVFEPFRTTKASGSGLGLYAVKTLAERDGATVSIEDNVGGGAVFVVRWRLAGSK